MPRLGSLLQEMCFIYRDHRLHAQFFDNMLKKHSVSKYFNSLGTDVL